MSPQNTNLIIVIFPDMHTLKRFAPLKSKSSVAIDGPAELLVSAVDAFKRRLIASVTSAGGMAREISDCEEPSSKRS